MDTSITCAPHAPRPHGRDSRRYHARNEHHEVKGGRAIAARAPEPLDRPHAEPPPGGYGHIRVSPADDCAGHILYQILKAEYLSFNFIYI